MKFPILDEVVDIAAPFESVDSNTRSKCGGCHVQEAKITNTDYPGDVYESLAIRPTNSQKVEVSDFKLESYKCDMMADKSNRCAMIYALYDHGEVVHENFPNSTLTFFDSFGL